MHASSCVVRCLVLCHAAPRLHACVHAPCMPPAPCMIACVHAPCSVLRSWELMGWGSSYVFLRCKAFFHNVFYTAGCFFTTFLHCRAFFHYVFPLQVVFFTSFLNCRVFFHYVFTLQGVFRCVFCAVLRFSVMFDAFLEPQHTFPEPMHTFHKPKHSFSEPQYVPVCRATTCMSLQ